MPIYEYECKNCLMRFEIRRRFGEDGGSPCPQCGNEARRLFSPVAVVFKGSGFYVTDNRKDCGHAEDEGNRQLDEDKIGKSESDKKERASPKSQQQHSKEDGT